MLMTTCDSNIEHVSMATDCTWYMYPPVSAGRVSWREQGRKTWPSQQWWSLEPLQACPAAGWARRGPHTSPSRTLSPPVGQNCRLSPETPGSPAPPWSDASSESLPLVSAHMCMCVCCMWGGGYRITFLITSSQATLLIGYSWRAVKQPKWILHLQWA